MGGGLGMGVVIMFTELLANCTAVDVTALNVVQKNLRISVTG